MTALGDFSAGDVLTAADLNAIGDWTDYTPSWENLTVGDGVTVARYCQINRIVFYQVLFIFGTTSSITGNIQMYYPVAADDTWAAPTGGSCFFEDASGADYYGALYRSTGTRATLGVFNATGTYVVANNVTATQPFTWASGDRIVITDFYRSAS